MNDEPKSLGALLFELPAVKLESDDSNLKAIVEACHSRNAIVGIQQE